MLALVHVRCTNQMCGLFFHCCFGCVTYSITSLWTCDLITWLSSASSQPSLGQDDLQNTILHVIALATEFWKVSMLTIKSAVTAGHYFEWLDVSEQELQEIQVMLWWIIWKRFPTASKDVNFFSAYISTDCQIDTLRFQELRTWIFETTAWKKNWRLDTYLFALVMNPLISRT